MAVTFIVGNTSAFSSSLFARQHHHLGAGQ
jgi:hypothetical protein